MKLDDNIQLTKRGALAVYCEVRSGDRLGFMLIEISPHLYRHLSEDKLRELFESDARGCFQDENLKLISWKPVDGRLLAFHDHDGEATP